MKSTVYPQYSKQVPSQIEMEDDFDSETVPKSGGCCQRFSWWSPKQNTLTVAFCNETSIHGFKFLGQEKRHISERIFWAIGFCASLATACYLIYGVYERYLNVPVIVSFQSKEQEMDTIPFPAVTFCNMNKFPKRKVAELEKISTDAQASEAERRLARKQLIFVKNICNAQSSFAKEFDFAFNRGSNKDKKHHQHYHFPRNPLPNEPGRDNETVLTEADQKDMTDFLLTNTIPCDQLIRLCILGEAIKNCSDLFKPIVTDYGKCCTFNIMPLPLLLKTPKNLNKTHPDAIYENDVLGSDAKKYWPPEEIDLWKLWNYEDGFVLDRKAKRPWRQKRSGLPYGLSILIDPNTEQYYCPASDSVGMRYILHTPLETPHVMEFSSLAALNKEILIEVHPDVTNADADIRSVTPEKRQCLFGREKKLRFFGPYTGGNCVDECTATYMTKKCNCTLFYMPRDDGVRICDSDPVSDDHECTDNASMALQSKIKDECAECEMLCEDIAYNYETTIADLQDYNQLWGDPDVDHNVQRPDWYDHKMSIVHIFFGADSTVPKYRKQMYGTTDLIANTGGILGLCLGFSILSGVEVLYFFTLRAFWKYCRKRGLKKQENERAERRANSFLANILFQNKNKTVNLNPDNIPVYPQDMLAQKGLGWGNGQGHHFYGHETFRRQNQQYSFNAYDQYGYAIY